MSPALYALVSVIAVSLISLVGLTALSLNKRALHGTIFVLVSLAVGALFGDALIHLIPEAFEESASPTETSLLIIAGFLVFFVLEKFLHVHHSHGEDDDVECLEREFHASAHCEPTKKVSPLGWLILISDSFHNFIDGIIIGVSYFVSIEVGIASTIAIMLHEIPQEIGDFGVLIHSGFTRARALIMNLLSALSAIVGVILVIIIGAQAEEFIGIVLPIAAGGFIYIAASDLVPELHKVRETKKSLVQFVAILAGIGAMLLLLLLE